MADSLKTTRTSSVERLTSLIETLRGENGCPWDKKQTPETMTRYLIEEVYELADAIVSNRADAVCEEAGDVLFQLLFVIALYCEAGHFCLREVVEKNFAKMVRRHPHVFGDVTADTVEKIKENWEKIKMEEKGSSERRSVLSSVPQSLPALLRASTISERAAKTGFDWDHISGVMAKTMEEWQEFSKEVDQASGSGSSDKASMEFGDLLFTMVNVARFARIHPETALIQSVQKFEKRFKYMEEKAIESGREFESLTRQEMNDLWEAAKDKTG